MQSKKTSNQPYSWIELVLFMAGIHKDSDAGAISQSAVAAKAAEYLTVFDTISVVGIGSRPGGLDERIRWKRYKAGESRSTLYNRYLDNATQDWVLFLEGEEELDLQTLPDPDQIHVRRWAPVCIQTQKGNHPRQYYQMRLVPAGKGPLFGGKELIDCTRYITQNEIHIHAFPVIVKRPERPAKQLEIEEELALRDHSPQLYLEQGERYFQERKYNHAAAQYRTLLKEKRLLPFDRLAGVNGLTACLAEQHKWDKALTLAQKSIEGDPRQHMPYLIQFRINELKKQWEEALQVLQTYDELADYPSRAGYDKGLSREETLIMLADLALKTGKKEEGAEYLDAVFNLKQGDVERSFLKKALILSIELSDYEKSVFFFKRLFHPLIPEGLKESQHEELNDFMSLIMNNGWYDYACRIYKQLFQQHPENHLYKRRLIVSLTKARRMEEARQLIG